MKEFEVEVDVEFAGYGEVYEELVNEGRVM